jgi:hypothetical protein
VFGRFTDELPVLLGELPRGLDGLAAAGREEDSIEVAGRVTGQPLGQVDRGRMRVRPQREVGQPPRLPSRDLG